jgi:hypothetical protein
MGGVGPGVAVDVFPRLDAILYACQPLSVIIQLELGWAAMLQPGCQARSWRGFSPEWLPRLFLVPKTHSHPIYGRAKNRRARKRWPMRIKQSYVSGGKDSGASSAADISIVSSVGLPFFVLNTWSI